MCEPAEIEAGDRLRINDDQFDGPFDVAETEEQELGLTGVTVAVVTNGTDNYSLIHAEGSREVSVEPEHGAPDEEVRVPLDAVEVL